MPGRLNCGFYSAQFMNVFSLQYVKNYLSQRLSETRSYLYVDSTCIFYKYKDFEKFELALNIAISSLYYGFLENKMNLTKQTRCIIFFPEKSALIELNIYLVLYLADTAILA